MTEHALRAAEDELQHLRTRLAAVAQWIHNPAYDRDARTALADAAGLPAPGKERTPWPADTSPGGTDDPPTTEPATYAEPAAPTSALAAAGTATTGSSAH